MELREIPGYPDYACSQDGKVYSRKWGKLKELKPSIGDDHMHYERVYLYDRTTRKRKTFFLHRVIALTWVPNPDGLPVVNHIDGNVHNNDIRNLEWCTYSYNTQHGIYVLGHDRDLKPVLQYTLDGAFVKRWAGVKYAADTLGIDRSGVAKVARGVRNKAGGFVWRYADGT